MKDYYRVLYAKESLFGDRLEKLSIEENIDWIRNYFFDAGLPAKEIEKKAFLNSIKNFYIWHIQLNEIESIKKLITVLNSFESLRKEECQILEDSIKARKQFVNKDYILKDNLFEIWKDFKELATEEDHTSAFDALLIGDTLDIF